SVFGNVAPMGRTSTISVIPKCNEQMNLYEPAGKVAANVTVNVKGGPSMNPEFRVALGSASVVPPDGGKSAKTGTGGRLYVTVCGPNGANLMLSPWWMAMASG